jgi:hypothetical protein
MARDELKRQHEKLFSSGVAEGRRLQQSSDQTELHEVREEIASLRAELAAAQAQWERLRRGPTEEARRRAFETQVPERGANFSDADGKHSALLDQPIRPYSPTESILSATSFATPLGGSDLSGSDKSLELPQSLSMSLASSEYLTHSPALSGASIAPSIESTRLPKPRPYFQPTGTTTSSRPNLSPPLNSADAPVAALQAWQTAERRGPKPVKNLKEMNILIRAARQPDNWPALKKVRWLLREAQATAKNDRTSVQNHLLQEWRSVEWDDGSHVIRNPRVQRPRAINPRKEDSPEVWLAYFVARPETLPPGVRRDDLQVPLLSDVKAFRTVCRLRPDEESSETRNRFKPAVARLFSVHGAYQESLMRGGINIVAQVTYRPYDGPSDVTLDDVASHFASCGITYAMADIELGPWAREYLSVLPRVLPET